MQYLSARVLNRVVDSLDLRIHRDSEPSREFASLVDDMRFYKESFEFGTEDFILYINEIPFKLKPSGHMPYEFVLINPTVCDIRVWNPDKWRGRACRQTGQLYLNFRSLFLQRFGIEGAQKILDDMLVFFFHSPHAKDDAYEKISRLDLACDVETNRFLSFSDLDSFVYRAKKIEVNDSIIGKDIDEALENVPLYDGKGSEFYNAFSNYMKIYFKKAREEMAKIESSDIKRVIMKDKNIESIYFGRFGSKLYARIYNKPAEAVVHGKLYMLEQYIDAGWDGKKPIYRIEFSVSGDFLKEFRVFDIKDCRDFKELEKFINPLWIYLSHDWLTHREFTEKNGEEIARTKTWCFSSFWESVSSAWDQLNALYVRDYSDGLVCEDDHLYDMVRGCLVSILARHYAGSHGDLQQMAYDRVVEILADPEFIDDVFERAHSLGLDDSSLSAGIRRDVLKRGKGS